MQLDLVRHCNLQWLISLWVKRSRKMRYKILDFARFVPKFWWNVSHINKVHLPFGYCIVLPCGGALCGDANNGFEGDYRKLWTLEIFMECYCVSTEEPITCEKTKPQTVTVISSWLHVATYCLLHNVYVKIKSKCSLFLFVCLFVCFFCFLFYELLMSHTTIGLPVISHISGRVLVIGSFQNQSVVVEIAWSIKGGTLKIREWLSVQASPSIKWL